MNTLYIFKAQAIPGEAIPDLQIICKEEAPPFTNLSEWETMLDHQAQQLAEALWGVLPGGIMDRLIGHLMLRRATALRIRLSS